MPQFNRTAESIWKGDLRNGSGRISTFSKALSDVEYGFVTRFENEPGTNPEELIAAAHAACFNMALASTLKNNGYEPDQLKTKGTCTIASKEGGGWKITNMHLDVQGIVPELAEDEFQQIIQQADQGCPVSNLLRPGVSIEIDASLSKAAEMAS
jgi:osmotically inducible protein OsmC